MKSNLMLRYALEYRGRNWSVIPCNGKVPAVSWSEYQSSRPRFDDVRRWFRRRAGYNVAVVTGSVSRIIVVDCDSESDSQWWAEHFEATPLSVSTGSGGTHFYYRSTDTEVRNRTRILGRRIDIRGDGGLVVAPPSTHPQTGRLY